MNGHGDQHSKEDPDEGKPSGAEGLVFDDLVARRLRWERQVVRDGVQLGETIFHLANSLKRWPREVAEVPSQNMWGLDKQKDLTPL